MSSLRETLPEKNGLMDNVVVDSLDGGAALLIEVPDGAVGNILARTDGLEIREAGSVEMMRAKAFRIENELAPHTADGVLVELRVIDEQGHALEGVGMDVQIDEAGKFGLSRLESDAEGMVRFRIPAGFESVHSVIAEPLSDFWPKRLGPLDVKGDEHLVQLDPITDEDSDALDRLVDDMEGSGEGIRVAVVDGGAWFPPDANYTAGGNFVENEADDLVDDNGTGHGSHVAAIVYRVAPQAEIRVYRVFGQGAVEAEEFSIAKAIRQACDDQCDVINLSFGQSNENLSITTEIERAERLGRIVVAATGNDQEAAVKHPARMASVIGVSACGHDEGTPETAIPAWFRASPPENHGGTFFAKFSNVGDTVDHIAPGVGLISFVADDRVGVMSGTSMATPVVSGLIARFLSNFCGEMDDLKERREKLKDLCQEKARSLGFGAHREGKGFMKGDI